MIVRFVLARLLSNLFGQGFAADLAGRGVVFLADGARSALRKDAEHVTTAQLRPGETYTVVARPRPTRKERKLAAAQASAARQYHHLTRPSRAQLRTARRLARTQRRLDRAREDSRRARRLEQREQRQAVRFDRMMRPSRRHLKVARRLTQVTEELERERSASFERARRGGKRARGRARVRFYD